MMTYAVKDDLKKLGLADKEAAVYLAALELGPASMQSIARRAEVVRSTTYVAAGSLIERGLMSKYVQENKTLFTAQPPDKLAQLIERQEVATQAKYSHLQTILPVLQAVTRNGNGKPIIRYYDGLTGLQSIQREITMYCSKVHSCHAFIPADSPFAVRKDGLEFDKQRIAKGIKLRSIFTTRSKAPKKFFSQSSKAAATEKRYIVSEQYSNTSGMIIFRDRVAIETYDHAMGGVVIENQAIANMMRILFNTMWISLEG